MLKRSLTFHVESFQRLPKFTGRVLRPLAKSLQIDAQILWRWHHDRRRFERDAELLRRRHIHHLHRFRAASVSAAASPRPVVASAGAW